MKIKLTQYQIEKLKPLSDEVFKAGEKGKPGVLLAQVWVLRDGSEGFMEARFLDMDTSVEIQKALGVQVGSLVTIVDGDVVIKEP